MAVPHVEHPTASAAGRGGTGPGTKGQGVAGAQVPPDTTLVIEDGVIQARVRRPHDLVRALAFAGVTVLVALLAYLATSTAAGLETDLSEASALLPPALVLLANIVSGTGLLLLPLATGLDLVLRRRGTQFAEALVGLLATIVIGSAVLGVVNAGDSTRLLLALAGSTDPLRGHAIDPILAGVVAFTVVARLLGRPRWGVGALAVLSTTSLVAFLSGGITLAGVAWSLTLGAAVGFSTRYAFGISSTRPRGQEIVAALHNAGLDITVLRAKRGTGRGRRYAAQSLDGRAMEIAVFDRDLEGWGLAGTWWRRVRLRDETGTGGRTVRQTLERSALIAYAAEAAQAPMPRLVALTSIGPECAVLCYERVPGARLSDLAGLGDLDDDVLDDAWSALSALHAVGIAHRDPALDAMLRADGGGVLMLDTGRGVIAATDLQMRLDVAEMLCTMAVASSPEAAVSSARRVLGDQALARALPAIQPFAFGADTRRALRGRRALVAEVRSLVAGTMPEGIEDDVRVERLAWRTVFTIVLGTIAGYVLITQLADVDLARILTRAETRWVIAASVFSLITYVAAASVYQAFVPERLKPVRTFIAQFAASFATLVTPSTVGVVATNMRYVTRSGVPAPLAAASIGLGQLVGVAVTGSLLVASGLAAGTARDLTFSPPRGAVIAIVSTVIVVLFALPLPPVRRAVVSRVRPLARQVLPRLVRVAQEPQRLAMGIGGYLLLNTAYAFALISCVRAFGGEITIASGFFIYLAGSTLGQAVPTPGGIGGVEAALAAGLTAAGVDAGTAISAVLLYRLVTFWVPTVPGWFAFRWLQSRNAL